MFDVVWPINLANTSNVSIVIIQVVFIRSFKRKKPIAKATGLTILR
jgi:hypothetical protein